MERGKKRQNMAESEEHVDGRCKANHAFISMDAGSYRSIRELADALENMSDDTFYYHVTDSKNDFANWIRDVFDHKELAEKLLAARTKEKHEIVLLRHLLRE